MAQRVLFKEPATLSETEEKELQALAAQTQRTPPLTPETAYLQARDAVGGESFIQARHELARLDKLDRAAERALNDYEERLERGLKIGRIFPNNAITLRRLFLEHQKAREAYNDGARRFESRLNALRTPEARAQIREVAANLLTNDQRQRQKLEEAAASIKLYHSSINFAPTPGKTTLQLTQKTKTTIKPSM